MSYAPSTSICWVKWRGHVCVKDSQDTANGATRPGEHTHECLCRVEWVTAHDYSRSPGSWAGNCWCGRIRTAAIHQGGT